MKKLPIVLMLLFFPLLMFSQRAKLYEGLPEKGYYKNGNLRIVRDFKEGQLVGYKTYYKSGQLRSSHVFNDEGYHDGLAHFYYPNGNIKTVWKYKKGVVKKRTNYKLDGEIIKTRDNKTLTRIKKCNYNLPYGRGYLGTTYKRAILNAKLGFYDEAIEDYHYILTKSNLRETSFLLERSFYHNIAITYANLEEYEKAMEYDFKALTLQSDNQAVLNNIGSLFVKVKDYEMALTYLDKCLAINPKNYHAFYNKAVLYLEQKDYQTALDFMNKTIADERSHKYSERRIFDERTIWTIRGEVYLRLGRYDEAIADLEKEIEDNPINSFAYKCLAEVYKEKNLLDKACEYLKKAQECKYDTIYNTTEVKDLLKEICSLE